MKDRFQTKIRIISLILFILTFFEGSSAHAVGQDEKKRMVESAYQYILSQQNHENNPPVQWIGEFPTFMENKKWIIALGNKGKRSRDSNCFTTALIYEELYRNKNLFKNDPKFINAMNLAITNIKSFKNGNAFNFWHELPFSEKMKSKSSKMFWGLLSFRPNLYPLNNKFAQVRANIGNDSDDTALANLALFYQTELANETRNTHVETISLPVIEGIDPIDPIAPSDPLESSHGPSEIPTPESTEITAPESNDYNPNQFAVSISSFLDSPTRKWHFPTNVLHGNFVRTGAFLTWLETEKVSFLSSPFKGWGAQLRIPEGVNNIDCVVNANILNSLTVQHLESTPGYEDACKYINSAVKRGYEKSCGLYYPNPYNLHFAVGKAFNHGAICLKESAELLLEQLLDSQKADGSWDGGPFKEPLQSTLYATHALKNFTADLKIKTSRSRRAYENALDYIYSQRKESHDSSSPKISWEEGTFFSGGGFVRKALAWKSETFSTALALSIFNDAEYESWLSE